jgi:hypothetical protein
LLIAEYRAPPRRVLRKSDRAGTRPINATTSALQWPRCLPLGDVDADSLHTLNLPVNSFIVKNFGVSSASVTLVILSRNSQVMSDMSSSLYSPFRTSSASFVEALQLNLCFIDSPVKGVPSLSACPKCL